LIFYETSARLADSLLVSAKKRHLYCGLWRMTLK